MSTVTVRELDLELSRVWGRELSAPWDNDGIMCASDPDSAVRCAVISLDATLPAILFAAERGAVLVTHHPMIFRGLPCVMGGETVSERVIAALSHGVPVLSYHTRLDAAKGGVNDALAEAVGLAPSTLETFGDDETPSIGRVGLLSSGPVDPSEFARAVKKALGAPFVRVTGGKAVYRVAVTGGAGGDFLGAARRTGADAYLTGEVGYNKAEDAAEGGFTVIEAGHYFTEAPVLSRIADAVSALGIPTETFVSDPQAII